MRQRRKTHVFTHKKKIEKKNIRKICRPDYYAHSEPLFLPLKVMNVYKLYEYKVGLIGKVTQVVLSCGSGQIYLTPESLDWNSI